MISYKSLVFRLSSLVFVISSTAFAQAPRVVPDIVDSVPHEMTHFTQGLFFDGKELIETTGLYGKSGLYRRTLDGKILDSARLAERCDMSSMNSRKYAMSMRLPSHDSRYTRL